MIKYKNMFLKKGILILLFFLSAYNSFAQMDIQLNSYSQHPYYITPAYINNDKYIVFTLAARKQWVNFNGAPTTIFGSVAYYMENIHTQVGLRAFSDKMGYTSVLDMSLIYAYNLSFNENWKTNLGLALSYQSLDYDLSKISFEGAEESIIYDKLKSQKGFNADVGVEIYNAEWRFGAASRNLVSLLKKENTIHLNTNYLYGIYKQNTLNPVDFGGSLFGIQYGNRIQAEVNAAAFFKYNEEERFHIGAFYRTPKQVGAFLGISLFPQLSLSYNYSYNFGFGTFRLGQTHEIMISYKLDPTPIFRWDELLK